MVRKELRGSGTIFCGKNTMIRRAMQGFLGDLPYLETLLPVVRGNIAFVFTNDDLKTSRSKIMKNVVSAPAKAGVIAPCDVVVPAGNTGMEPGKVDCREKCSIFYLFLDIFFSSTWYTYKNFTRYH